MKISKTFGMTISGAYQSYKFETSIETDAASEEMSAVASALVVITKNSTLQDVDAYAKNDKDFAIVLATRNKELEKLRVRESYAKPQ